jgi:hypothetical protein
LVGTAPYAQEFAAARLRLLGAFGNGIDVLHGLPILADGLNNSTGTVVLMDLFEWIEQFDNKRDFSESRKSFLDLLNKKIVHNEIATATPLAAGTGSGTPLAPSTEPVTTVTPLATVTYRLYMLVNYESRENTVFEVTRSIPTGMRIDYIHPDTAIDLINTMAEELNTKYMTGLGPVSVQQPADEDETSSYPRLIFVGGSYAARMAAAADILGFDSIERTAPDYCL